VLQQAEGHLLRLDTVTQSGDVYAITCGDRWARAGRLFMLKGLPEFHRFAYCCTRGARACGQLKPVPRPTGAVRVHGAPVVLGLVTARGAAYSPTP
jgi:hypothetical protein